MHQWVQHGAMRSNSNNSLISKGVLFSAHPVQGVPQKVPSIEIILLLLSIGFHAPGN